MNPIIALWTHPRSLSTAIERVMRERGDLTCFHEPFMYDYYIHRQVRVMPHFDVMPNHPRSYEEVRDMILAAADKGPVFLKDMAYYLVPRLFSDREFADRLTHSFLMRSPIKSIVSYYKLDPELTMEEVGLEALAALYDWAQARDERRPPLLDAEAVLEDPKGVLRAYWRALGLEDKPDAFSWDPKAVPSDWHQVAGWHGKVQSSGGIQARKSQGDGWEAFEALASNAPRLKELLHRHEPFYQALKPHALQADQAG